MSVGTLACALGIGFAMQNASSSDSHYAKKKAPQDGAQLANADAAVLDVEDIMLTSGELSMQITPPAPEEKVTLAATPVVLTLDPETTAKAQIITGTDDLSMLEAETAAACPIDADARAMASAMINLTLQAPCLPNERVTVLHNGLLFNQITDEAGAIDVVLPAMATDATIVVAFSNGEGGVAQTTVEEFSNYARVAVQWKGDTGFELHAREYGADYGAEGHVWSQAARDMSYGVTGGGGYLTRLGDPEAADGLMAEVYTFPSGGVQSSADVEISVEAEVAQNNCGLEIEAETLQTRGSAEISSSALTLSVPDCDAAGNFLVLNNLFEDLKVASN